MTAFAALRDQRPCARWALAIVVGIGVVSLGAPMASAAEQEVSSRAAATIVVHLDQAGILRLPEGTATLVVGNPLIADVTVQPGGVLVLTGKSFGVTNLVALDRAGTQLMDHSIEVQGPRDKLVAVYRGVERESYSCTPNCDRRITIGDAPVHFGANLLQFKTFNNLAQGGDDRK
jgi:Flp pilus assembly secretin CpaC